MYKQNINCGPAGAFTLFTVLSFRLKIIPFVPNLKKGLLQKELP